ncbi:Ribonuclease E [Buchnera aphidicola (Phyllaphis fagi)]|uniref:Rne/Rng family ribonuclease n=1 Tax=Buchnera aphidicola TaxID=9 RepID=UPI003463994D
MKKMLINVISENKLRVAVIQKNKLYDFKIENNKFIKKKLNIYKGIIIKIEFSLEAIFVNYEDNKIGFLPFKEISKNYFLKNDINFNIYNMEYMFYKKREIVVQIIKEEKNNKKAVLTTFIKLLGNYIILLPKNSNIIGISKRIQGMERLYLNKHISELNIPKNIGLIIRTVSIGKSIKKINQDIIFLLKIWEKIKKISKNCLSPSLIYQDNNMMMRIFRDYLDYDIHEIIIDNIDIFNLSHIYLILLGKFYLLNKIILYTWKIPLFLYYNIENQINLLFKRKIQLPSGGLLIIDFTESLTVIDVNSSKCIKNMSIEETALYTNLESIDEIIRQLRIRDIGGLIVIDFINMQIISNNKKIEHKFKQLIIQDQSCIKMGRISKFGILELSRKKLNMYSVSINHYICSQCKQYYMC